MKIDSWEEGLQVLDTLFSRLGHAGLGQYCRLKLRVWLHSLIAVATLLKVRFKAKPSQASWPLNCTLRGPQAYVSPSCPGPSRHLHSPRQWSTKAR